MRGAGVADSGGPGKALPLTSPPSSHGGLALPQVVAHLRPLLRPPLRRSALRSGMADLFRLHDPGLAAHSLRTANLVRDLAYRAGYPPGEVAALELAALSHDLGKLFLPLPILLAPRALSPTEMALVRTHPGRGASALLGLGRSLPPHLVDAVLHHHERWDGQGYPTGLAGLEIPFAARLVAVVDVLDAMTHPRPHQPARSLVEARAELLTVAGRQLDPVLVLATLAHSLGVPFAGRFR